MLIMTPPAPFIGRPSDNKEMLPILDIARHRQPLSTPSTAIGKSAKRARDVEDMDTAKHYDGTSHIEKKRRLRH